MADMFTWITFHAHPSRFDKKKDHHPDFYGVFVCPPLRREPEKLLGELLANRNLFLVEAGASQLKSSNADWGSHERLKTQSELEGYGLSLTKMHTRAIPID